MLVSRATCAAFTLLLSASGLDAQRPGAPTQRARVVADTLISTDDAVLERPADMALLPGRKLAILDYGSSTIVVVSAIDGSVSSTVGRRGRGPGDLFYPLGLTSRADTVITANVGNGRIEYFPPRPGPTVRLPAGSRNGRIALNVDGGFLLPTAGQHGSLVRLYTRDGKLTSARGTPVVEPDFEWRLAEYRLLASRGIVPDYFRNQVIVAMAADSSVWVAFQTEGRIEQYSATGGLLKRVSLPAEHIERLTADYRRRNVEESTGTRVIPLEFFADIDISNGTVWILLNSPEDSPTQVMSIESGGLVTTFDVIGLPRVWRLLHDPTTDVLYFSSASEAAIYSAVVPRSAPRR